MRPWFLVMTDKAVYGEKEWYFFSPRDRKYPNGMRPNRAAGSGYWKATGTDKVIVAPPNGNESIGVKKALVFYQGRPPKGSKTSWIMHEYRLTQPPVGAIRPAKTTGESSMRVRILLHHHHHRYHDLTTIIMISFSSSTSFCWVYGNTRL